MNAFTGTGTLIRFMLRRDRIRIPIWIIAFVVTLAGTAAVFPDTYPTEADRQSRATLMENPAMRLLIGPLFGSEDYTFGAMMASEMLGLVTVVIGLMSIFMIVRHTRAEEETGRAELVRSSVVGQHATMTAALIVVTITNIAVAVAGGLAMVATLEELDLAGSMTFAMAMISTGVAFAAIAAISVQINEFSRSASGMAIAVLGVTYVLRGFGDVLENPLRWTPPFGLSLQSAPYVLDRLWPLILLIGTALLLIPVAYFLSTKRDVGASLRPARPGAAHASPMLSKPLGLQWRLQRGSVIAWGIGLTAFALLYGSMTGEIGEMYATNPIVEDYFAVLGLDLEDITNSVIAMFSMFLALAASIFTVSVVTRLRSEETSLRAENVLATAVSRIRWAGESLLLSIIMSTLIIAIASLISGIVRALDTGDVADIWIVAGAMLIYAPALWVAAAVATAVFGLFPRAMALAWIIPAYGFFALMIGPLLGLPNWLYNLSPFEYIPRVPSAEFEILPLVVLTLIALILIVAGLIGIRRRDLDFT
jgi:ABC-2 type transport system permease protein